MNETQEAPDHVARILEQMAGMEKRRGLVAAEQRGLGDIMASYFDRVDQEARELYQEWSEVPPPEILPRQSQSIETILPEPDPERLMPSARVSAY